MAIKIHPTALVDANAQLGDNVSVGPYAIIEAATTIGDDCVIDAYAMIRSGTSMGRANRIFSHAVIGGLPQDLGFDETLPSYVEIGNQNVFRENVTVSRPTQPEKSTRIASNCYLMNNSHIGHDCVVGENNIIATGVALGGHVQLGQGIFIGGGTMIHQFCRIGSLVIISGAIGISKDVIPYTMIGGLPAHHFRLNMVGLRRAGIKGTRLKALSTAFRCLRERSTLDDIPATDEIEYLKQWLADKSKRGIHGFLAAK